MDTQTRTNDTLLTVAHYLADADCEYREVRGDDWLAYIVEVGADVSVRIHSNDTEVELTVALADRTGYPTGEKVSVTSTRRAVIVGAVELMLELALQLADA